MSRQRTRGLKSIAFLFAALAVLVLGESVQAKGPKNVIVMIADGSGFNSWDAASMYEGKWDPAKGKSTQVYDGPGWTKYACTTYPLNLSNKATGDDKQAPGIVYEPAKAWDTSPISGTVPLLGPPPFAGYKFLMAGATDSAAAATALATGTKTYNASINWSNLNQPLSGKTLPEIAKSRGKAAGAITTVEWSHATPAGLGGAHNPKRDDYAGIANEMLKAPYLDVIMGAGNPDFDDDGKPLKKPGKDPAKYVGGEETWKLLTSGQHPAGWKLIQTKAQFEALAGGKGFAGIKVLGTAQAAQTLQQARGKYRATDTPFSQPLLENVPDLATMSRAALSVLESDPDGFYLMIEGGAVDWANHSNQAARMIEEQADFNRAVQAVVGWVEKHSNWDETLLILTADHETGMLWGKNSDTIPFDPIRDNGKGKIPDLKYNSKNHTNSVVPLFVRGAGSERFASLVRGTDSRAAAKWHFSGQYVDNTDVFKVACAALVAEPTLVPAGSR